MLSRASALVWPLRAFAGWRLTAHCVACRLLVEVQIDRLRAQRGDWCLVVDAVTRLRCSRCHRPPASVAIADGMEGMGQTRPVTRLVLLGAAEEAPGTAGHAANDHRPPTTR